MQYSEWATGWRIGFKFPVGAMMIFSIRHLVRTGSGAHPHSWTLPGGKAAGTCSCLLTSI